MWQLRVTRRLNRGDQALFTQSDCCQSRYSLPTTFSKQPRWKTCRSDRTIQVFLICFCIFFIVYGIVLENKLGSFTIAHSGPSPRTSPSPSPSSSVSPAAGPSSCHDDPFFLQLGSVPQRPCWELESAIVFVNIVSIVLSSTAEYKQMKERGKLAGEEEKHMRVQIVRCSRRSSVPREGLVVGDLAEL
eukprot:c25259_g2_i1 orf=225-788(+)